MPSTPTPSAPPLTSNAPASNEPARPDAEKPGARPRRSIPILALGVVGALVSATYAHFAMGMRFSPPLVMMGLGGLTLVLAAFALWRVLDPLTRDEEVRAATAQRAPLRIRELEREKLTVLKAIKEIELDYQMKKIAEPDYREMVERYRARALRVMSELAAGDDYRALIERELKDRLAVIRATAAAASTNANLTASSVVPVTGAVDSGGAPETTEKVVTGACEACGIVNDLDARFCKRCGIALTPPPASVTK